MGGRDWLVTEDGQCEVCDSIGRYEMSAEYYRLYHFLNDLENILKREKDDRRRLQLICPLVRRLLMSSYWLQSTVRKPDPATGWSVLKLYDEPFFPWTVQTALWPPKKVSPIHNHAAWGVVALISGHEKNTFWKRANDLEDQNRVERVGDHILVPGDVISFMPDAIHSIKAVGDQPTITFNVYGETNAEVIYFNGSDAGSTS
jgi:predicted metal-dependent enzyme (double-stranded beta helix superfamily)